MELLGAIKERRSIRKYTTEIPPQEALECVLEAGRWVPSGLIPLVEIPGL